MAISEYEKCTLNSNKAILLLTVTDSSQKTNKKVWVWFGGDPIAKEVRATEQREIEWRR